MNMNPEQFAAANKANIEALVELTQKAFAGIEKLVELNMQAARSSMEESAEQAKAVLGAKDPQALLALQSTLLQPSSEKALAYGRQVYDIAVSTQAEVSKMAEAQVATAQEQIQALVDTAIKNAPAGSENAVALMKSSVAAASNAFESVQKAAKQASSAAEANFEALSKSAETAAKAATPKAARRA
ncbi:MAG: phasin family protein [Leptothrix sp. (in: b-proteobacteria)]|jgi:phasin family protein